MVKFALVVFGALFVSTLADHRIVGGDFAKQGQFPHQILLKRGGSFTCGGSIISENFVLTASHCVVDGSGRPYPPEQFTVVAGVITQSEAGQQISVRKVISHEKYGNFMNDIALLRLNEPVRFDKNTNKVELHAGSVPAGQKIIISGFGRTYQGGPVSEQLKYNTLTSVDDATCAREVGINHAGLICLGHSQNNGACNGDSGGPALYNGKLVGVANFVVFGCGSSYPDGYAKVPYFLDWIAQNTQL